MSHLAQSEKAVTNSEPMGCPKEGPGSPAGSKTPTYLTSLPAGNYDTGKFGSVCDVAASAFRSVFNGLRAASERVSKRFGGSVHYLRGEHARTIVPARFGPNFVTIQPLGESVWSV